MLERLVDGLVSLLGGWIRPSLPVTPAHGWLLPAPARPVPRRSGPGTAR
jgi:hypothetical protein